MEIKNPGGESQVACIKGREARHNFRLMDTLAFPPIKVLGGT